MGENENTTIKSHHDGEIELVDGDTRLTLSRVVQSRSFLSFPMNFKIVLMFRMLAGPSKQRPHPPGGQHREPVNTGVVDRGDARHERRCRAVLGSRHVLWRLERRQGERHTASQEELDDVPAAR